jgi:uncharacterized protein YkwD
LCKVGWRLAVGLAEGKREVTLRYRWFIVAALAVLFVGSLSGERDARADNRYDSEELKFLKILNEYRQNKGLGALVLSDALTEASELHSEDMGRYNFFDHNSVKSSHFPTGFKPWDRMARSGYDYPRSSRAENLAEGYETAQKVFEAWRASPGHDHNMLDGVQRVIGIARVHVPGSKYGWYWTTDFGSEVDPTAHAPGEAPPSEQKASEKTDKAQNTDGDGVENGSMEGDAIWEQTTAEEGKSLIEGGMARLGGYDDAEDEISQKIQAHKDQKLIYRVRIDTEETEHPADGLVVSLTDENGDHLATIDSHTDADAEKADKDGWIRDSVDLSQFAGESVRLGFLAKTDSQRPTTFYVDDVALE